MIYLLHHRLNEYEINALNSLMLKSKYPHYKIVDIYTTRISPAELNGAKIIYVYDETKTKGVFEKKFEQLYASEENGSLFIDTQKNLLARIDRPATFMKDQALLNESWKTITSLCDIERQILDIKLIPETLFKSFGEIVEHKELLKTYMLKSNNGKTLEIRPEGFPASQEYSVTFNELLVLATAKYIFNFDSMNTFEIISS